MASRTVEQVEFKKALGQFPSGVAVLTANTNDEPVGMTIQSLVSLSLDPLLVMFSIANTSTSWPAMSATGNLVINVLARNQSTLGLRFASRAPNRFEGVAFTPSPSGGHPVLEGTVAWMECRIVSELPGGDHRIVLAEPIDVNCLPGREPLVYFNSGFGGFRADQVR
ncbi:NADH-FMN oxidoreductase RutF, flavin reductase (DIM6/NTAB) family [Sinosporangium album]|uniref:NADH-FMN oxidoreductase RutF, flavin reductase (DIM6/NTAB) family n=1 Tax=Sinosporangium album TaxID=504805 RepID=A0A1G8FP19_9ACTN|nr:flavin reductase family protein [Sinosporangium album]SDH83912.1 NADH-FMN oxidoreductase RutF, flavin reductase (DIM6/NTAB) family [Sinosporangium album]